jgi:hypothetical protein
MKRILLPVVAVVLTLSGQVVGAIVYSGAQNVTLELQDGGVPSAQQALVSIAGSADDWDDFIVDLWFESAMAPMGMSMGTSRLTISTAMGRGMGGIVGLLDMNLPVPFALNLPAGEEIGPSSPLTDVGWAVLFRYGCGLIWRRGRLYRTYDGYPRWQPPSCLAAHVRTVEHRDKQASRNVLWMGV